MSRSSPISYYVLLLLLSTFTYLTDARTSDILKVKLNHGGVLVGRHLTSLHGRHIRAFLGVPYAKPPVGDLRFKAPVSYGSWDGERLAIKDSDICIQRDVFVGANEPSGSEDCLYLNVYAPEEPQTQKPLPVMVWFHGGGFFCGSGVSNAHSPKYIMDRDVIYVSANYRLGALGFLSTETLHCPGNFGFKDQTAVLKWVQQNIAAFGGNPKSVTIFGVSAGGASVTFHMISEKSKGLFHKVIAQSGTFYNPWALSSIPGESAQKTRKVAQKVGCAVKNNRWFEIIECLRTKSSAELTMAISQFYEWQIDPMIPLKPVVEPEHDDAFLTYNTSTDDPASIPLMIGFTSDEGLFRTAEIVNSPHVLEDLKKQYNRVLPLLLGYHHQPQEKQNHITRAVMQFYLKDILNFDKNNFQNFTDMTSDAWFITGIDEHIKHRLSIKDSSPTYMYVFDHKGSSSVTELFPESDQIYGASHGDDTLYIFPIAERAFVTSSPKKRDREVRQAMLDMWINFASNSDPTPPGTKLPKWSAVKDYPPKFMLIGSKDERDPILRFSKDYPLERINFWHAIQPFQPRQNSGHHEL